MKLLIAILVFFVWSVNGQEINGTVLETDSFLPLEGVHVILKRTSEGTSTNMKGKFTLKIKGGFISTDSISFSMVGYKSSQYSLEQLESFNFQIILSKLNEQLKQVTVTSRKELQTRLKFKTKASLKRGLHSFGAVLHDDMIYVIGGDLSYIEDSGKKALIETQQTAESNLSDVLKKLRFNPTWEMYSDKLHSYDLKTNTWQESPVTFRKRANHSVIYYNNKLYVLGGKRLSTNRIYEYLEEKIEVYDLKTKSIQVDETNPHKAINGSSFVYEGNIIILGGSIKTKHNGKKVFSNAVHMYNLDSGYWYELSPMLSRKASKGVLIGNKIYLIGGFDNKALQTIESYNLSSGKWNVEGTLLKTTKFPALTLHDQLIYIYEEGTITIYNLEKNTLNMYAIDIDVAAAELFFYNDTLYLLGGFIETEFSKTPSNDLYSIAIEEFSKTKVIASKSF